MKEMCWGRYKQAAMRTMEKIVMITVSVVGKRGGRLTCWSLLFLSIGWWEEWMGTRGLMGLEKEGGRRGTGRGNALKMNFSVGVSMYKLKVTSYWYRLRCSQRNVEAHMDIVMVL